MTTSHDTTGREYAKLSQLKPGDWLEADNGFDCIDAGARLQVHQGADGSLFVYCHSTSKRQKRVTQHWLDGQADDGEHLVGLYPITEPKA